MESESKAKVIVIGTLGIGKSTVMNKISDGQTFNTSDEPEGCTKGPDSFTFNSDGKEITVVDTAGLNDNGMPLALWITNYTEYAKKSDQSAISLAIIAFKASIRPSAEQKSDVITALKAIKGLSASNVAIIFTFCESLDLRAKNQSGKIKANAWLDALKVPLQKVDGGEAFCNTTYDRIFFYSNEDGKSGSETTQNDLLQFIKQHADFQSTATMNTDLKVADVVKSAVTTMDAGVLQLFREQMAAMKELYEKSTSNNEQTLKELKQSLKDTALSNKQFQEQMTAQKLELQKANNDLSNALGEKKDDSGDICMTF